MVFITRREKRSVGPGLTLNSQPSDPVPIITEQEAATVVNMVVIGLMNNL